MINENKDNTNKLVYIHYYIYTINIYSCYYSLLEVIY
nr:MAG TPA: hypothetical protein [Bacteriophage sp.]